MSDLTLRPIHYASVSGGKDSLYMLGLILNNLDKYPLDMVVHFDLDIDWDWAKRVVDMMEERCSKVGVPFLRIKPRKTWEELYEKYGFPNNKARWCNSDYKLDCKKQLNKWIREQNCRPVAYIGFCADETARFKYELGNWEDQEMCYPLAEEGIEEWQVQLWARKQPIFEGYYKILKRQGCKMCPNASMREMAFLLQTEPDTFDYMMNCIRDTEKKYDWKFRKEGVDVIEGRIRTKWKSILYFEQAQMDIFDYLELLYERVDISA